MSDADGPKLSFRDVAYFDTNLNKVCSIDPDSCLALLRLSHSTFQVVDWRTENQSNIPFLQDLPHVSIPPSFCYRVVIRVLQVVMHSNLNYLHAMCVCGPYVLCFRQHSVDAFPLPTTQTQTQTGATDQPLPVLHHTLPGVAFSAHTTLSRVRCTRTASDDDVVYALCALTQDSRRGTSLCQVRVHVAPVAALSVRLLALNPVHADGWMRSALDVGSSGLRGAWTAFNPNTVGERRVVAFTTPACPSQAAFERGESGALPGDSEMAPRWFEERVVWVVSSWDSDGELGGGGVVYQRGTVDDVVQTT